MVVVMTTCYKEKPQLLTKSMVKTKMGVTFFSGNICEKVSCQYNKKFTRNISTMPT